MLSDLQPPIPQNRRESEMAKYVFVVFADHGLEGFGRPVRAFDTEELANLYASGAREFGGCKVCITALEVEKPEHFEDASAPSPHKEAEDEQQ